MKRIWSILIVAILLLSFSQDANAAWRGRGWAGYHYGWGYRPFIPPVPLPYYRPYYAPVPGPVWIAPHYRVTPYGRVFIPGHYAR